MRPVPALLLLASSTLVVPALAADNGRVKVGSVQPWGGGFDDRQPSAQALGDAPSETISVPGAAFLRIHFRSFRLAPGDVLTVSRPDGGDASEYTGRGPFGSGSFWSLSVDGDTAVLRLQRSGARGSRYQVDSIVNGEVPMGGDIDIKSICGDDGTENVACRLPEVNAVQRPVARLNFMSGGGNFVCTGWLVRGSNTNTMMTNNHCVDTLAEVQTVEARFNHQTASCTGTALAPVSRFMGTRLLRTSGPLDYTLLTLSGNAEATWGELIPTQRVVSRGQAIWIVQHPGGRPKRIGYFEDAAKTRRCDIESVRRTVRGYAAQSQIGYSCDTAGGASGSPVIAAGTNRAVGLHHLGGCQNSGTHMSNICQNAGSLLTCAGD